MQKLLVLISRAWKQTASPKKNSKIRCVIVIRRDVYYTSPGPRGPTFRVLPRLGRDHGSAQMI